MIGRRRFLALAAGLLLTGRAQASGRVEAFLSQMTVRQKVGQLFLFSLAGRTFSPDMARLIGDYHAGGMVLFSSNVGSPESLAALTNAMQRAALGSGLPIPLLIAADQEGGRVLRLQGSPYSPFPSPMALGAADDLGLTARMAAAIAREMAVCGLNMNLAPVLDVNTQPDNPVINVRAFGSDPARVAAHGRAFIEGTQGAGVVATGKHFPGHGSTSQDSHFTLPVVDLDQARLLEEMRPFAEGVTAGVGAMMTAHILYQALDAETPATFSAPILTDLLRGQVGFGGVVMSDALTMEAVSQARQEPIYIVRDALRAGVDMLAYGAIPGGGAPGLLDQINLYELVVALAESGLLEPDRLDQSVRRILALKEAFGLLDWRPVDETHTSAILSGLGHAALLTEAAEASVTLLSDGPGLLPLSAGEPLAVLFPAEVPLVGAALAEGLADVLLLPYPASPSAAEARRLAAQIGGRRVICATWDTARYPGQVALINALPLDRLVVVAVGSPYDIRYFPLVQTYLMTYGASAYALAAVRRVLLGEIPARGVAPVSLI